MTGDSGTQRLRELAARGWLSPEQAARCYALSQSQGLDPLNVAVQEGYISAERAQRLVEELRDATRAADTRAGSRESSGISTLPFEPIKMLGQGGMARVYEVAFGGERAALKVLDKQDEDALTRFAREVESLTELGDHPHIVGLRACDLQARPPWLLMELIEGPSLAELIDEGGPLDWQDAARLGAQVANALAAAHARGVWHRDLKPSNVLLTGEPSRAVVADFGLAKATDADTLTASDEWLGTLGYMAPERFGGDNGAAADVWALGALLCECVSGSPAFSASNSAELVAAVLFQSLDQPATFPKEAAPLWPLICACLDRNPSARPRAQVAAAMLQSVAETGELPAGVALPRPSRLPPLALSLLLSAALLLGLGLALLGGASPSALEGFARELAASEAPRPGDGLRRLRRRFARASGDEGLLAACPEPAAVPEALKAAWTELPVEARELLRGRPRAAELAWLEALDASGPAPGEAAATLIAALARLEAGDGRGCRAMLRVRPETLDGELERAWRWAELCAAYAERDPEAALEALDALRQLPRGGWDGDEALRRKLTRAAMLEAALKAPDSAALMDAAQRFEARSGEELEGAWGALGEELEAALRERPVSEASTAALRRLFELCDRKPLRRPEVSAAQYVALAALCEARDEPGERVYALCRAASLDARFTFPEGCSPQVVCERLQLASYTHELRGEVLSRAFDEALGLTRGGAGIPPALGGVEAIVVGGLAERELRRRPCDPAARLWMIRVLEERCQDAELAEQLAGFEAARALLDPSWPEALLADGRLLTAQIGLRSWRAKGREGAIEVEPLRELRAWVEAALPALCAPDVGWHLIGDMLKLEAQHVSRAERLECYARSARALLASAEATRERRRRTVAETLAEGRVRLRPLTPISEEACRGDAGHAQIHSARAWHRAGETERGLALLRALIGETRGDAGLREALREAFIEFGDAEAAAALK